MTAIARYQPPTDVPETYREDPTGGRLVAWAAAAQAANQLAKALVTTTFVPKDFAGNVGDATAAVLMGDELGLSPLASLRSIFVVHGTPAMYARTMVALAQAHGHEIWTEIDTTDKVTVCGRRRGSDKVERSEWTIARARKAGYTTNKKYDTNPQEMLWAKAASTVARKVAADVLAGVPYSVEDLELDQPVATTTVTRGAARKSTAQRAPLAPVPAADDPGFDDDAPQTATADEPTTEPAPEATPSDVDLITDPQMRKMQAGFRDLNLSDRADRIAFTVEFIGRDIDSSKDLTKDEATALIDEIERRVQNRAAEGEQG